MGHRIQEAHWGAQKHNQSKLLRNFGCFESVSLMRHFLPHKLVLWSFRSILQCFAVCGGQTIWYVTQWEECPRIIGYPRFMSFLAHLIRYFRNVAVVQWYSFSLNPKIQINGWPGETRKMVCFLGRGQDFEADGASYPAIPVKAGYGGRKLFHVFSECLVFP